LIVLSQEFRIERFVLNLWLISTDGKRDDSIAGMTMGEFLVKGGSSSQLRKKGGVAGKAGSVGISKATG
jgi:hypothetical protein